MAENKDDSSRRWLIKALICIAVAAFALGWLLPLIVESPPYKGPVLLEPKGLLERVLED